MFSSVIFKCCTFLTYFMCLISLDGNTKADDYLVCKSVHDVFGMQAQVNATTRPRGPQGSPGKRGPRGYKGPPGPKSPVGPKAEIDWNAIDQRIKNKMEAAINCSGLIHGQYCYRLPYTAMTYSNRNGKSEAAALCAFHGGTLADLESEEMFNRIFEYVRKTWVIYVDRPNIGYMGFWLASTYQNGEIRGSAGTQVWYPGHPGAIDWYPGYPAAGRNDVAIQVGTTPSLLSGMWTPRSSESHLVPLCRFPIV